MELARHIFRAYDIRGVVPTEINPQVCKALGRALASCARTRGLNHWSVSGDGRISSPELTDALAEGLMACGAEVTNIGLGPTPVLYYATMLQPDQCGVMVTGSHNPKEYNGLKMMIAGTALAGDEITELYHKAVQLELDSAKGSISHVEIQHDYIRDLLAASAPLAKPLKLVVDAGNGAAGALAPALYRKLGCEVIELFCEIDGNFPNHHPDPSKLANLRDLQGAVIENQADLGFAFDGDGDRLGIVTDTATIIYPDKVLMLFADDLLTRHPSAVVLMDVKCSPLVFQHILAAGGKPQLSATGHSLIKRAMQREGALLAGEMSGHMYFAENWNGCDDALIAGARLLGLLSRYDGGSSELFALYPSWFGTPEINLNTSEESKWQIIDNLRQHADFGDGTIITIDGIRVEYQDSWGLIRSSNTSPVLVLRFEASKQSRLKEIVKHFADQITKVAPDIDISPLFQSISNYED